MENLDPPPLPPKSRMGKWSVFAFRAASSLIWAGWGFAVPFYFVQDCSGVGVSIVILRAAAVVNKTNFVTVSFWDGPNSAYNCSFFLCEHIVSSCTLSRQVSTAHY